VDVLESAQDLVEEVLDVVVRNWLVRLDDCREVRLHELADHVDVIELLIGGWFQDRFYSNYVLVLEQPKNFKFSEGSLHEDFMLECPLDFFYCH